MFRFSVRDLVAVVWFVAVGTTGVVSADRPAIELVEIDTGYQLQVDGQPFFIKGGGGDGDKALLAASGGNAFRTWGVGDDTPGRLQRAKDNGLMVAVGFWLGHERHGFDYTDAASLEQQKAMVRAGVLKYRDHPSVLMWVLGNEMEGFGDGGNLLIWQHIQELAEMVKELDPDRPTATVVAEIGGARVESIHRLCPDIDIVGVNSYGGGPTVGVRYREAGGTKPYMISEFGPPGTWEVDRTAFDAAPERTSTQKAEAYLATWDQAIEAERDRLCLGGFAFTWGFKQEATATWFGMFLPDGSKLAAVDAMTERWTGHRPENLCPVVEPLSIPGGDSVKTGQRIAVDLAASDPDGDPIDVEWKLHVEDDQYFTGGDFRETTAEFPEAIIEHDAERAVMEMPENPGVYRIYAYVRDGRGGAAIANIPVLASPTDAQLKAVARAANDGKPADLPLWVYADGMFDTPYTPSGYMGGAAGITMTPDATDDPKSGATAMKVAYDGTGGWAGVVWQDPPNDWGDAKGGYDLTGAEALTFWARGERGGEKVKFGFGVLGRDKPFYDTAKGEKEFTLTTDWQQFTIPLAGRDLSRIKTGFMWVAGAPVTFYLDDIAFVDADGASVSAAEQAQASKPAMTPGEKVSLPAAVYREGEATGWVPSGYMGNSGAVKMLLTDEREPFAGERALRVAYDAPGEWAGVVWQNPPDDWGDVQGGFDLRGAKRLAFHARGERGGETVKFGFGLLGSDTRYPDSDGGEIEVTLTPEWRAYEIDLTGKDLQRIKTGFSWVAAGQGRPIAFYLDEVRYE
ncbi:MAG: glycoside hydrolase family 2 TIM barrel-domain containing protein [Planctomycetota bacterium]